MSIRISNIVKKSGHPALTRRLMPPMLAIADRVRDDGTEFRKSLKTLAGDLRASRTTAMGWVRDLREAGLIVRGDQSKVAHLQAHERPVVYDINVEALLAYPREAVSRKSSKQVAPRSVPVPGADSQPPVDPEPHLDLSADPGQLSHVPGSGNSTQDILDTSEKKGRQGQDHLSSSSESTQTEDADSTGITQPPVRQDAPGIDEDGCVIDPVWNRLTSERDRLQAEYDGELRDAVNAVADNTAPASGREDFRFWALQHAAEPVHVVEMFLLAHNSADFGRFTVGQLPVALSMLESGQLMGKVRHDDPAKAKACAVRDHLTALSRRITTLTYEAGERQSAHRHVEEFAALVGDIVNAGGLESWVDKQTRREDIDAFGGIVALLKTHHRSTSAAWSALVILGFDTSTCRAAENLTAKLGARVKASMRRITVAPTGLTTELAPIDLTRILMGIDLGL